MKVRRARFISDRFIANKTYLPLGKYVLATAYKHEGRYPDKLEWLDTYLDPPELKTLDNILNDNPDIICFSMYVWSAPYMCKIAKYLRDRIPDAIFIAGGADIRHQTHDQYMNEHPWFDYVIYGAGEDSFVKLIDLLIEQRTSSLDLLNVPNLIYRDKLGKVVKTKHEVYKGKVFTELSPWLLCKDEVKKDADYIKNVCKSDVYAAWEPDRGCPYKCSFCDWGYGLHNKVTKKKFRFEQELDLFKELDATIMITAANVGMFPEDIEYMEYIYRHDVKHMEPSWAKNQKKQVAAIWRKQIDITGELRAYTSLQSITEVVLQNIDRPCIPWPEIKKMLLNFREEGHEVKFYPEIIAGLPGETVESWNHMMHEFMDMFPLYHIRQYEWVMLPNSPGADQDYQKRLQLDVRSTRGPHSNSHHVIDFSGKSEDDVMSLMSQDEDDLFSMNIDIVWGSYNNSVVEKLYFIIAAGITSNLSLKFNNSKIAKKIYQSLKPKMWARAQEDAAKFDAYYKRYGHMTSFVLDQGKMYNYIIYWGSPAALPAIMSFEA